MGKLKELAINGLKILALGVLAGNRSARSRMGSPSAINRLCDAGDLSKASIRDRAKIKAVAVQPWLHHQAPNDGVKAAAEGSPATEGSEP
jgi:hypothetical protein